MTSVTVDLCSGCQATGFEPFDDRGVRRVRHCTRCDYWSRKRGDVPGLPNEERARKLADYVERGPRKLTSHNKTALLCAAQFVEGLHPDLYLHGGTGTGKTALGCAILTTMYTTGNSAAFFRVPELLLRLSPDRVSDEAAQSLMRRLAATAVIVLDDVGADQGSDYTRRTLQMVYEQRTDHGLRTIWTSNLDPQELAEFLSDSRLVSRIVGRAKVVEMAGPDFRVTRSRRGEA